MAVSYRVAVVRSAGAVRPAADLVETASPLVNRWGLPPSAIRASIPLDMRAYRRVTLSPGRDGLRKPTGSQKVIITMRIRLSRGPVRSLRRNELAAFSGTMDMPNDPAGKLNIGGQKN